MLRFMLGVLLWASFTACSTAQHAKKMTGGQTYPSIDSYARGTGAVQPD